MFFMYDVMFGTDLILLDEGIQVVLGNCSFNLAVSGIVKSSFTARLISCFLMAIYFMMTSNCVYIFFGSQALQNMVIDLMGGL